MNIRPWLVRLVLIFGAVVGIVPLGSFAQTGLGSEEEVKKAAATLFDEGEYAQAYKLYSQLLATYPQDPNYNYRFGVCRLFSQADKDEALTFLEKAAKDPGAEKDVFFYLGRAYHLNYRFDDAIKAYERFKKEAGPKSAEKLQVNNHIASCRTGKKLLKSITDLTVLEKKELSESNFYSSYDLRDYNGKLLVKPDDFKTAIDKKKKEKSVIFLPTEKTEIYFSSYGNDEENGKDIYIVRRLPNGGWSKPQNVGYPINTEYDEDYPFLHPGGKILYFCSKGHNSMGGYDIFKSTLNEETNTWTKPVNLDFAINTPDDDILYITDYEGNTAYFSSSRSSPTGQMTVYRVRVERRPADICLIKGSYKPSEGDENLKARIIVKNKETDNIEGIFQSNEKNGEYLLNLPNGGKFEITVEKNGKVTQTAMMFIPPQYEIKAIRQEMGYDANKKLYVNTLFENDSAGLSADFLKERAKLNVSTAEPVANRETTDLGAGKDPVTNNGGTTSSGTDPVTNNGGTNSGTNPAVKNTNKDEEVKAAYTRANEATKDWKNLDNQVSQAYAIAARNNREAISKNKAADEAQREADAATDPEIKKQEQQRASDLRAQANTAENNTVAALNMAQALERDAVQKKEESDVAGDYAKKLDAAVKKNDKTLLDQLADQKNQLELFSKATPESVSARNGLKEEADKKAGEAKNTAKKTAELRDEINEYDSQIAQQQTEADNEKDPQLKAGILAQLGDLKEERNSKQNDLVKAEKRENQLNAEMAAQNDQLTQTDNLLEQVKNGTGPSETIAAADKQKLQNDARSYEREISESGTSRPVYINGSSNDPVTSNGGTNSGTDPVTSSGGTSATSTVPAIKSRFEEPLTAATNSSDPYTQESSKAEVYNDWVQAIDAAITEQKDAASKEKDREKKRAISDNITALEKEKKEKQTLAQQAEKRAEELKTAVASNNSGTDPVTNNGGATRATNTVPAIQSRFEEPLTAATNSSDPYTQESSKAEVYNDWVQAIDAAITEQKDAASKEKDRKKKQAINDNIAALEKEKKEKQTLAQQAEKRAEELKTGIATNNGVTDPVTNNGGTDPVTSNGGGTSATSTVPAIKSRFEEPLTAAINSSDPYTQESSKAEVYNDWVQAIDAAITEQKDAASKEKDREKKQAISDNITALEKEKKEKQTLAQQAEKRAEELKTGVATNNGGTDPVTNNGETNGRTDPVTNNGATDPANTTTDYNAQYTAELAAADRLTDPYEKAKKRNSLHKSWIVALNSDLATTRNELKTETDKTKKDSLKAAVKTIETKLAEEKRNEQASGIAMNTAKKEQDQQAAEHPELAINNRFENELKQNTQGDNPSAAQVDVLKNWSDALQAEADNKKKERDATRDKKKKIKLEQQITVLEEQATARQEEAAKMEETIASSNSNGGTDPVTNNGGTDPVRNNGGTDPVTNNGGTDPVRNNGGTDPVTNNGGTDPVRNNGGTDPVTNNGGTDPVRNNGGTDPVTNNGGADPVRNNGGTDPVTNNGGADPVRNNGGTDPVTNNGGTDPVTNNGGADPVRNNGGTDPVTNNGGADPVRNNGGTDPVTNNGGADPVRNNGGTDPVTNNGGTDPVRNNGGTNPVNPTSGKLFTNDELAAVKNSSAYKNYSELQQEAVKTNDRATTFTAQADDYKKRSANHIRLSQEWTEKAASATDPQEKATALQQAGNENQLALADKSRSDSVRELADNTLAEARSKQAEADQFLNELDKNTYEQVKAVATTDPAVNGGTTALAANNGGTDPVRNNGDPDPVTNNGGTDPVRNNGGTDPVTNNGGTTDPVRTNGNSIPPVTVNGTNTSAITPRLNQDERYAIGTRPVYNEQNRIPVNTEVPSGVIYKVQVGAFRNPIPQDIFKGITPITGETTPQGITRYTAGQFTNFNTADAAKEEIRGLGYRDAFVVAFRNGKRISVEEARGDAGSTPVAVNTNNGGTDPVRNNGGTDPVRTNGGNTNSGSEPTARGTNPNTNTVRGVTSTQVTQVRGLFYTVQVGVYSRPVTAAQLYNLADIFTESLPNGNTRYFAGSYNKFRDASGSKNSIVGRGIRDAFITAYKDGKRISLSEARTLSGEADAAISSPANNTPAGNGANTAPENNGGNTEPVNNGGNTTTPVNNTPANNGGSREPENNGGTTTATTPVNNTPANNGGNTEPENNGGTATTTTPVNNTPANNGGNTEPENNGGTATTTTPVNNTPANNGGNSAPENNGGNTATTPEPVSPVLTDTGLVYRVQLGAFSQEVPIDIANKFLQLARRGVRQYKDSSSSLTVYVAGRCASYAEAEELKTEAVEKGIRDAFIVAFNNGKKISTDEAKKLSGE